MGVDVLINVIFVYLVDDSGLVYECFFWCMCKDCDVVVVEFII